MNFGGEIMDSMKSYKCPCCSDALLFNADTQILYCESCGNEFPFDTIAELDSEDKSAAQPSKYDWEKYEERSYDGQNFDFSAFSCSSCGAEITGEATAFFSGNITPVILRKTAYEHALHAGRI